MHDNRSQARAILIATLGTEPQVVTAALDLLIDQRQQISQVKVVHTTAPGTPIEAATDRLKDVFEEPPYKGQIQFLLEPISDKDGHLLQDVDTPLATQVAFRFLYNQVRKAKKTGNKVHLLIAGGRKTLAVFGMVTAQLLFDEGDHLWHLYSSGDFLQRKQLHPESGDEVHLIQIPVVQWSTVSPILLDFADIEDPLEVLRRQEQLHLDARLEDTRAFVRGSLTPAEERVVVLLVKEGLKDQEIAERLYLSPRTVEQHLRSVYMKAAAHWNLEDVNRTNLIALLNLFYAMQITGNPA